MDRLNDLIVDILPLTTAQQGILLHEVAAAGERGHAPLGSLPPYHVQLLLRFTRLEAVESLEAALAELVRRHDALRTVFRWKEARSPVQVVLRQGKIPVVLHEVPTSDPRTMADVIEDVRAEDRSRPFDLLEVPFRAYLLRAGGERALLLSWHHVLLDGWSASILVRELITSATLGRPSAEMAPANGGRRAFFRWLKGASHDTEYWRRFLEGAAPTLLVPGASGARLTSSEQRISLSVEHARRLERAAARHGVTVAACLYAAWGLLLQRWTRSRDVLFGYAVSGRRASGIDLGGAVGMFVNTLPMRVVASPNTLASELVAVTYEALLDHGEREHTSLARLQRAVLGDAPGRIFDSVLAVETYPLDLAALREAGVPSADMDESTEYPVLLTAVRQGGWTFRLSLRSAAGDPTTPHALLSHWLWLLEQMIDDLERPVAALTNLSTKDEDALLSLASAEGPPPDRTVIEQFFMEAVPRWGDRIALVDREERVTYAELASRVARGAAALRRNGVRPGDRVGVHVTRDVATLVALMAVMRAGAAYVPIGTDMPAARADEIAADAGLRRCVARGPVPQGCAPIPIEALGVESEEIDAPFPGPVDVAYLLYTSGSSGRPKGIELPHRAIPRVAVGEGPLRVRALESILLTGRFEFDVSVFEIWSTLLHGGKLVIPTAESLLDGAALEQWIRAEGVTSAWLIASLFNAHIAAGAGFFARLERVFLGGEALSAEHVRDAMERFPDLVIVNGYGPTENGVFSTEHVLKRPLEEPIPIGRAVPGTRMSVLDEDGHVLPPGAMGELAMGGDGVALGYVGLPEETRARFIADPRRPGERVFLSGDLGQLRADGVFLYRGRRDGQTKVRGFRIETGEVEQRILRNADAREAVVVLVGAHGEVRLEAFVVGAVDCVALLAALRLELPEAAVPARIHVVNELPRLPSGKIDRVTLAARAMSERPVAGATSEGGAVATQVAAAWKDALGGAPEDPRISFFAAGGTSLDLVRFQSRLLERTGQRVSIADLFRHPTPASLTTFLSAGNAVRPSRASALPRADGRSGSSEARVAVIGMAGRFPGASSADALWALLRRGGSGLRRLERAELRAHGETAAALDDASYVPVKGILDDIAWFDGAFFGYSTRECELMDPQIRLLHTCAWEALEDAACDPRRYEGRVGVFASALANPVWWAAAAGAAEGAERYEVARLSVHAIAGLIAHALGLSGPAITVDTACSSSASAIHLAAQSLREGACDVALAAGVSIEMPSFRGYRATEGMIHAASGRCRPFDAAADGTVTGDGAAVLVLKRLDRALADGDPVLAVLAASAINNDARRKASYTAPSVDAQVEVIRRCLAAAGFEPSTIGRVEAHGTATRLGDPVELAALREVFGDADRPFCAIGAAKGNLGHLNSAAGAAGVMAAILALRHRVLPPIAGFQRLNPEISELRSPFVFDTAARTWDDPGHPRRAVVSSFGIGGTNVHLALEEAPPPELRPTALPPRRCALLPFSGPTPEARAARVRTTLEAAARDGVALDDVARTLQEGRRAFAHRTVLLVESADRRLPAEHALGEHVAAVGATAERPIVFVLPGQGSLRPGLLRELGANEPDLARRIEDGLARVARRLGVSSEALYEADARMVAETQFAQPLLFVTEHALASTLRQWGIHPDILLGHSVGEWVAACLSGILSFDDALDLVVTRGAIMQALPTGRMLAISLPIDDVAELLRAWPALDLCAINGPEACVVGGPVEAITALQAALHARRVASVLLATSHAFHTRAMDAALEPLTAAIRARPLGRPQIPLVSSRTGRRLTDVEAMDARHWAAQTRDPVRFGDALASVATGHPLVLEVGPGQALTTLARRHPALAEAVVVPVLGRAGPPEVALHHAVASAWCHGAEVDWSAYGAGRPGRRVSLGGPPWQPQRYHRVLDVIDAREGPEPARAPVDHWVCRPAWQAAASAGAVRRGPMVVVGLDAEAERVAAALVARGLLCRAHRLPWEVADARAVAGAIASLRVDLQSDRAWARPTFVLLAPDVEIDDAATAVRRLAGVLAGLAGLLACGVPHAELLVVVRGAFPIAETDVVRAPAAALVGAAAAASTASEGARVTLLDVDHAEAVAEAVAACPARAQGDDPGLAVRAVRAGRLLRRDLVPAASWSHADAALSTGPEVVWVLGAGGIGAAIAARLLEEGAVVVLSGQSSSPSGAIAGLLHEHAERAHWIPVDARSPERVDAALASILARHGKLDAAVLGAGTPGGGVAEQLDPAVLAAQLAVKVQGGLNLLEALRRRAAPGVRLLFCSSLASVAGGWPGGQIGYAAAAGFLDGLAAVARSQGMRAVSVSWDAWRGVGMARDALLRSDEPPPPGLRPLLGSPLLEGGLTRAAGARYAVMLDPRRHWVLSEHRADGVPVLPATGFAALALEALARFLGDGPLELEALSVLCPLLVQDGRAAWVYVDVTPQGDACAIEISAVDDLFTCARRVHATGRGRRLEGEPPTLPAPSVPLERARFTDAPAVSPGGRLRYGPRWRWLREVAHDAGATEGVAELSRPSAATPDDAPWVLDPALLDVAMSFLDYVGPSAPSNMVPVAFEALRVWRRSSAALRSHLRRTGACAITTTDGEVVATLGAVVMRPVVASPDIPAPRLCLPDYQLSVEAGAGLSGLRVVPTERRAPGPGEVEVRVLATGVNFKEVLHVLGHLRADALGGHGLECAGRIERVGAGVRDLAVGDDVVALGQKTCRGYAIVRAADVARRPARLGWAAAATLPIAYVTAWVALVQKAQLHAGQHVLIHSAATGVGLAAVHVARWLGARICATAGTEEKRALLTALGVEVVSDSRAGGFVADIRAATQGRGVDVVLSAMTGERMTQSFELLAPGGRFVDLAFADIAADRALPMRLFASGAAYMPLTGILEAPGDVLRLVTAHVEAGHLPPLPVTPFAVHEADQAYAAIASARHIGKVVLVHREARVLADLDARAWEASAGSYAAGFTPSEGARLALALLRSPPPWPHVIATPRQIDEALRPRSQPVPVVQAPMAPRRRPRPPIGVPCEPPRDETERRLVGLVEEHLGVEPVGIDDNWFDLGATSLDLAQLGVQMGKVHPGLTTSALFAHPTVRSLVRDGLGDGAAPEEARAPAVSADRGAEARARTLAAIARRRGTEGK